MSDAIEYEYFFQSEPNDVIRIDGWAPVATNRFKNSEHIEELIRRGVVPRLSPQPTEPLARLIAAVERYLEPTANVSRNTLFTMTQGETGKVLWFKLEPTKKGTKLVITESGFNSIPDDKRRVDALRSNTQGWDIQAKNIAQYVEP